MSHLLATIHHLIFLTVLFRQQPPSWGNPTLIAVIYFRADFSSLRDDNDKVYVPDQTATAP
ncbi:MAG: hypothetical protein WAU01_03120 [Saprospiraceae bacterium]